jgi:hypothetical protein
MKIQKTIVIFVYTLASLLELGRKLKYDLKNVAAALTCFGSILNTIESLVVTISTEKMI